MKNEDVARAQLQIKKSVASFVKGGSILLRFYDREDLEQEVFTHFLEKGFFEKFDESITTYQYFIARAAKNYLIDLTRKRVHLMKSLDEPIEGKDGAEGDTVADFISSKISDAYSSVLLKEILQSSIKVDDQISPNYDLTWHQLLTMILDGKDAKDIREVVKISSARISQLMSEVRTWANLRFA